MTTLRQRYALLHNEAVLKHSRLIDVFAGVELLHAGDKLSRSLEVVHGELVLRMQTEPDGPVTRKPAARFAHALPTHLLACACAGEPRAPHGGWARELSPTPLTCGACTRAFPKQLD